ncbi:hypothetical protein F5Y10DRAFT_286792 [Nemania abortiva]|nr:hypothetical protein F5Y10DRAFT_286792 [Nemania abortiva]
MEPSMPAYAKLGLDEYCPEFIRIEETIKISDSDLPSRAASLGIIANFPREVIDNILSWLDAQSVARFARVSVECNTCARKQLLYRDLIKYAPKALLALSKVGLIGLFPMIRLYTTLRTRQCTGCNQFGPFLFLPSCKRWCYNCLHDNTSNLLLRMLPLDRAKVYFALNEESIKQLPILNVIPGQYGPDPNDNKGVKYKTGWWQRTRTQIVSVEAARNLGIMIHGSAENLASEVEKRYNAYHRESTLARVKKAVLNPRDPERWLGHAMYLHTNNSFSGKDEYHVDKLFGTAFVPFPSVSESGAIEHGLRCRGCLVNVDIYPNVIPYGIMYRYRYNRELYRAYSVQSFLSHIKGCDGVKNLRCVHEDESNRSLSKYELYVEAVKLGIHEYREG